MRERVKRGLVQGRVPAEPLGPQDEVLLRLTPDEALLLFDYLHRLEDDGAEERLPGLLPGDLPALWALSCLLESALAEPFDADYARLVADARQRMAAEDDA